MSDDFVNPFDDPLGDVESTEAAIQENVRLGYMEEVGLGPDGDMRYRMTDAGTAKVRELLAELNLPPEVEAMMREGLGDV